MCIVCDEKHSNSTYHIFIINHYDGLFICNLIGLCNRIYSGERLNYSMNDLANFDVSNEFSTYSIEELDLDIRSINLKSVLSADVIHFVFWKNKMNSSDNVSKRCVLYLHTNTRNVCDALEVIPLCSSLNMHLLAFDLPGHGKSKIDDASPLLVLQIIKLLLEWLHTKQNISEVILWARGMSTAAAIEFSSISKEFLTDGCYVCYIVLDTPYTSIRDIVDESIQAFKAKGYYIPTTLLKFGASIIRQSLKSKLGIDPCK